MSAGFRRQVCRRSITSRVIGIVRRPRRTAFDVAVVRIRQRAVDRLVMLLVMRDRDVVWIGGRNARPVARAWVTRRFIFTVIVAGSVGAISEVERTVRCRRTAPGRPGG
jgi:hypothetical protein